MIDFLKAYVKYILLHRWNKVSNESFNLLEEHWKNKPTNGAKLWLYNKVKLKNNDQV
jgi:hypothetical protein